MYWRKAVVALSFFLVSSSEKRWKSGLLSLRSLCACRARSSFYIFLCTQDTRHDDAMQRDSAYIQTVEETLAYVL